MFFGLQVKAPAQQAKPLILSNALKLSQAVLEPSNKKEPVSLMVEYNKKQIILCILENGKCWQSSLDHWFEGGSQVKFFVKGSGTVHLSGYENFDDLDDMSMSMSDEEVDSDEVEEEATANALVAKKLMAAKNSPSKEKTNGLKAANKQKNGKDKPKEIPKAPADDDDDEDESDDEDFDADDLDEDDDDDDMEDEDMSDEDVDEIEESSELESDDE